MASYDLIIIGSGPFAALRGLPPPCAPPPLQYGYTAAMMAARGGQDAALRVLVDHGADLNVADMARGPGEMWRRGGRCRGTWCAGVGGVRDWQGPLKALRGQRGCRNLARSAAPDSVTRSPGDFLERAT